MVNADHEFTGPIIDFCTILFTRYCDLIDAQQITYTFISLMVINNTVMAEYLFLSKQMCNLELLEKTNNYKICEINLIDEILQLVEGYQ